MHAQCCRPDQQFPATKGRCSVQLLLNMLGRGSGRSIAMAVGGARECLFVEPGLFNVILDRRLGFVRIALETGARPPLTVPAACAECRCMQEHNIA